MMLEGFRLLFFLNRLFSEPPLTQEISKVQDHNIDQPKIGKFYLLCILNCVVYPFSALFYAHMH